MSYTPGKCLDILLDFIQRCWFSSINLVFQANHGVFGPYWFQDSDGRTVTINGERYQKAVDKLVADLKRKLSQNQMKNIWFMQDGAKPHTANATLNHLKSIFGRRLIGLGTDFKWAPHSPNLNPLDFFFWGALKNQVYTGKPASLDEIRKIFFLELNEMKF